MVLCTLMRLLYSIFVSAVTSIKSEISVKSKDGNIARGTVDFADTADKSGNYHCQYFNV